MSDTTLVRFAESLVPSPPDARAVASLRAAIEQVTRRSTGSMSVYTIDRTSMVSTAEATTLLLAFHPGGSRPERPEQALAALKSGFDTWVGPAGRIIRSGVRIDYDSGPAFHIVPAYYLRDVAGVSVLSVPGPGDEWCEAAPLDHYGYLDSVDRRHDNALGTLVRLLKAWRDNTRATITSRYLELQAAHHVNGQPIIVCDIDLRAILRSMSYDGLGAIRDPMKAVKPVPAASEADRPAALRCVQNTITWLQAADEARRVGNRAEYWHYMYRVFGADYPYPTWSSSG